MKGESPTLNKNIHSWYIKAYNMVKKQISSKDQYTNLQCMIRKTFGPIKHSSQGVWSFFLNIWSPHFDNPLLKFGSFASKTLYMLGPLSKLEMLLPHFQQWCFKTCIVGQGWSWRKKIDIQNFNFPSLHVC